VKNSTEKSHLYISGRAHFPDYTVMRERKALLGLQLIWISPPPSPSAAAAAVVVVVAAVVNTLL
jgi:hypothetical protein